MRQLVPLMHAPANILFSNAVLLIPGEALVDPLLMPFFICTWHDEIFNLHLLELARAECKIARCDFVAEGLADLGNPKGQLLAHRLQHVVEVNKNSLRCFWAQICLSGGLLDRA